MFNKEDVAVLHCISNYPVTDPAELNLNSIPFMKGELGVPVGYSDHTKDILACMTSCALGADIIEKHFTLDKGIPFGDHPLSADPSEMDTLVKNIRWIEASLGEFKKEIADSEMNMKGRIRRGIYAGKDIEKGKKITHEDIICLRPQGEIPVSRLELVIGHGARRDIKIWEPITLQDID